MKSLLKTKKRLIIIIYFLTFFNLFFKSVVKSVDFVEEIGTFYDLLIYLLDNSKTVLISTETQINFIKVITVLITQA